MADQSALYKIRQVSKYYIGFKVLSIALLAVAISAGLGVILTILFAVAVWWILVFFFVIFGALLAIRRPWQIDDKAVAGFLNAEHPELEESCYLVLKPVSELNLLEKLQLARVETALQEVPARHKYFTDRLKLSGTLFVIGIVLIIFSRNLRVHWRASSEGSNVESLSIKNSVPEKKLPQIDAVSIVVMPPAYTHQSEKKQSKFTLEVVEGSAVRWELQTNVSAKNVSFLFNEQETVALRKNNAEATDWRLEKTIGKPGFYQVVIDGKRSELYQIQIIKDMPPVVQIKTPKQYTYIDAGEKPQITVNATVSDDYGISDAFIYATVAKGSGEAVKFKEQKIAFATNFGSQDKKYDLQKLVDLPSLNMEPGDELYFYVQAKDNHEQVSRTDVYIVSIQDTAALLSMDGILAAGNLKPDYFRSERQIIIDSQALLKAKDSLSKEKFNEKSNDLGTDQKLLRLRYGKFLGEEAEDNIGDKRLEGGDPLDNPQNFSNADKILDAYTDKHDNAEDAQFFDPTIKAQLKATLTEMWKAELQLRLYKPQDALPFEFKALRLLKDLQQKSRSFVAKTAYNPQPLKMEKRLSGDLSKIIQPAEHQDIHSAADQYDALKKSVTVLEQLKRNTALSGSDYRVLQSANLQLSSKASQQPGLYLGAANAMRRILAGNKQHVLTDVAMVETAIQKILPANQPLPQTGATSADMGLSQGYYLKLNRLNR
jgi:hypothetical protein